MARLQGVVKIPGEQILEERGRHGWISQEGPRANRVSPWSTQKIAEGAVPECPVLDAAGQAKYMQRIREEGVHVTTRSAPGGKKDTLWNWIPKHALVLDRIKERFPGFTWTPVTRERSSGAVSNFVEFHLFPSRGRHHLSLFEAAVVVEPSKTDFWGRRQQFVGIPIGHVADFGPARAKMDATGVGYKGFSGVSWRPGWKSLPLRDMDRALLDIGEAYFLLNDACRALYGNDLALTELLDHKLPNRIPRIVGRSRMQMVRPDIAVVKAGEDTWRFILTEAESAPGGQGMGHVMQLGYNLPQDMTEMTVELLEGRPLVIVMTHQWAEYLWEQAVWARALRDRGVDVRIILDAPLEEIHDVVQSTWTVRDDWSFDLKNRWNADFLGRIAEHPFADGITGVAELPEDVGNAMVFRFGYLDNFGANTAARFKHWEKVGATFINSLFFGSELKSMLAAVHNPAVMDWIMQRDENAVDVLRDCIATTHVLGGSFSRAGQFNGAGRSDWLTKYAGGDGGNMSWGARSVEFGFQAKTDADWHKHLVDVLSAEHPVVAQRLININPFAVGYVDDSDRIVALGKARVRVTPFLIRMGDGRVVHAGSTGTFREGTRKIHGSADAVEMPVVDKEWLENLGH